MTKSDGKQLTIDYRSLVDLLKEKFAVSKCSLMLLEELDEDKFLVIQASTGLPKTVPSTVKMSPYESAIGNITSIGEGILVENVEQDPRYKRKSKKRYTSKSFICVPIKTGNKIYGLISITDRKAPPYSLAKPDLVELCTLVSYLFRDFKHDVWLKADK
jgi:signal transduction protein with GAF and PtsI domain